MEIQAQWLTDYQQLAEQDKLNIQIKKPNKDNLSELLTDRYKWGFWTKFFLFTIFAASVVAIVFAAAFSGGIIALALGISGLVSSIAGCICKIVADKQFKEKISTKPKRDGLNVCDHLERKFAYLCNKITQAGANNLKLPQGVMTNLNFASALKHLRDCVNERPAGDEGTKLDNLKKLVHSVLTNTQYAAAARPPNLASISRAISNFRSGGGGQETLNEIYTTNNWFRGAWLLSGAAVLANSASFFAGMQDISKLNEHAQPRTSINVTQSNASSTIAGINNRDEFLSSLKNNDYIIDGETTGSISVGENNTIIIQGSVSKTELSKTMSDLYNNASSKENMNYKIQFQDQDGQILKEIQYQDNQASAYELSRYADLAKFDTQAEWNNSLIGSKGKLNADGTVTFANAKIATAQDGAVTLTRVIDGKDTTTTIDSKLANAISYDAATNTSTVDLKKIVSIRLQEYDTSDKIISKFGEPPTFTLNDRSVSLYPEPSSIDIFKNSSGKLEQPSTGTSERKIWDYYLSRKIIKSDNTIDSTELTNYQSDYNFISQSGCANESSLQTALGYSAGPSTSSTNINSVKYFTIDASDVDKAKLRFGEDGVSVNEIIRNQNQSYDPGKQDYYNQVYDRYKYSGIALGGTSLLSFIGSVVEDAPFEENKKNPGRKI